MEIGGWKESTISISISGVSEVTLNFFLLLFVAAIREMYKVKPADYKPIPTLVETERWKVKGGKPSHEDGQFDAKKGKQHGNALRDDHVEPKVSTFLQLADDEFYDVPEDSSWDQDHDPELESQNVQNESEGTSDEDKSGGLSKFSAAATIVKRLQAAGGSSPLICLQLVYWKKAHMTIEQSHQKHHRLVPRGLVSMLPSPQN
jgi:hypothetical protein